MAALQDERPGWKKAVSVVITVFCVILIAYVIVSWIPGLRSGPVGSILETIVGPVVSPIRKVIPPMGGLDLSVLVLYLVLSFIQRRFLR
jgi:uncharacterized protein YggT (Ycf19 family)